MSLSTALVAVNARKLAMCKSPRKYESQPPGSRSPIGDESDWFPDPGANGSGQLPA